MAPRRIGLGKRELRGVAGDVPIVKVRFASVGADRMVAWCSYTRERRRLRAPTHAALTEALEGLGLTPCEDDQLVRLGPSSAGSHRARSNG